jgi:hypothetical protein
LGGLIIGAFPVPAEVPFGTHTWHARAIYADFNESEWSQDWHFSLQDTSLSITRFDMTPASPSNAETVNVYVCPSFQVSTTIRVRVNTATDGSTNGEWIDIGEHGPCPGDPAEHVPIVWNTLPFADGTHLMRTEARDNDWVPAWSRVASEDKTYTLQHRRPERPNLRQPIHDSWSSTRNLTYAWAPATNATSYRLCVSTDPSALFCNLVDQTLPSSTTSHQVTLDADYRDVYWTVTASNDVGSNTSVPGHFGMGAATCCGAG